MLHKCVISHGVNTLRQPGQPKGRLLHLQFMSRFGRIQFKPLVVSKPYFHQKHGNWLKKPQQKNWQVQSSLHLAPAGICYLRASVVQEAPCNTTVTDPLRSCRGHLPALDWSHSAVDWPPLWLGVSALPSQAHSLPAPFVPTGIWCLRPLGHTSMVLLV